MTELTAEWCREQALMHAEYEKQYLKDGQKITASEYRNLATALCIAAHVLDADAAEKLANEMHAIIWGGHEPSGWKSFIGEARIAIAYLKGEAS